MLWLIGIGIDGCKGISLHALEVLNTCDIVYIERFTSSLSDNDLQYLNSVIGENGKNIVLAERWFVEDGREILEKARKMNIALLSYGDPMIATTHTELYTRAIKNAINVNIIHAASGISSLIGETGLHMYKFGRTVTIMSEPQSAISVYNTIFDNLLLGNHTLILTEYNMYQDRPFFLDPAQAFKMLLKTEEDIKYNAFSEETFVVVTSRIGLTGKKIISGKVKSLVNMDFGVGPHSVIVTGSLHFTEVDALTTITCNLNKPNDNTTNINKIAVIMIKKYAPKAKHAIKQMKIIIKEEKNPYKNKGTTEVLENAEYYIDDAERFLRQNKFELAILSMGYAEGLIDSLRFQKGVNPWTSP